MKEIQKSSNQVEIKEYGKLLDANGNLIERGYSRQMYKEYNREDIKVNKFKIKEWDYYLIHNKDYGVALTIADNGYMGLISASLLDFNNKQEYTKSVMTVLPLGKFKLPSSSKNGDVHFENKKVQLSFVHTDKGRHLTFKMDNFEKGKGLTVGLYLEDEPKESIVVHTPFEKPKHFYYNQKIVGFKAKGIIQFGEEQIVFSKDDTIGILDWGRGVWTYKNTWLWGAGAKMLDGKMFGFNIGYGFGNTSSATENMLFYDGIGHKLNKIVFEIPQKEGQDDFMSSWKFTSSDNRFEMQFTPLIDRHSDTNAIVLRSNQHQIFGLFNGIIILDDGSKLEIKDMLGFAEKVFNKW